ncbi:MAG TPA: chemotaxis protein CheD [Terracidiphilus sp.]|jgi:chemotaxis protein CheD|nr:chemotaxis protein CheD [Terracidiphilus sp.]
MDNEDELAEVYVQPGESHLTTGPVILRTLLGSCVGVAFLALPQGVGALCHPMLPHCPGEDRRQGNPRRYVDYAIHELAQRFDALSIPRSRVVVKLFGGADVLQFSGRRGRPTVGRLNCEAALDVLRDEGFEVAASSLGGNRGLNLRFNTRTGEVLVRRLN